MLAGQRVSDDELRRGDLVTYGPAEVSRPRVLARRRAHPPRDGADHVQEEEVPAELHERRRAFMRFER